MPAIDPTTPSGVQPNIPGASGYQLIFSEEFNSGTLDPKWRTFKNYADLSAPNNFDLNVGGNSRCRMWYDSSQSAHNNRCHLDTNGSQPFSTFYAVYECRTKMIRGRGHFPAFWAVDRELSSNPIKPELDFFECYGADGGGWTLGSADGWRPRNAAWTHYRNGAGNNEGKTTLKLTDGDSCTAAFCSSSLTNCLDLSAAFHTFTCAVTPNGIINYFDGVQWGCVVPNKWTQAEVDANPLAVTLDIDWDAAGLPPPNATDTPGPGAGNYQEWEYVRAWHWDPGASEPPPATAFSATLVQAPAAGATIGGTVNFVVDGTGIENCELLPPTGYSPKYGTFALNSAPSSGTHFYVSTDGSDSNPGTQSQPFRTITKADSVAVPDCTIHVASGNYTGGFTTSKAGTSSGLITFVSDTKWGAKIIPPASGSSTAWTVSGQHSVVDGFDVDGQSSSVWRTGILLQASNSTAKNCRVHHVAIGSPCDSTGGGGIITDGFDRQSGQKILNCRVHHIGPGAINSCGTYSGIYLQSATCKVENNLVYQVVGDGIVLYHDHTNCYVINNTVFRCGRGIIFSGGGFYNLTVSDFNHAHNNIVYDNVGSGLVQANIPETGSNCTFRNNLVVANGGTNFFVKSVSVSSDNRTTGSPGFVSYVNDGSGDYHLASGSQCIDNGYSALAPAYDHDNNGRPAGAAFDIGAFEFGSSPVSDPADVRATLAWDTTALADGNIDVRIAAFNAPAGQSGSEIAAMAARTYTINNAAQVMPVCTAFDIA